MLGRICDWPIVLADVDGWATVEVLEALDAEEGDCAAVLT